MGLGGPGDPDSFSANKRRKTGRDRGIIVTEEILGFHTGLRKLPIDRNNVELYVHIKSKVPQKPMKRLNRWLLEKHISNITKTVTKASFNREGDLILKVKGEDEAAKLIKTEKLGEWQVEVTKHATLNTSKGVVFSTDMCWQDEADIVAALQERCNVKEVYIPKRRKTNGTKDNGGIQDDQLIPTGIIIITFDQVEPPTVIPYGFEKIHVRPYIPNPMKCVLCQELGHTKNRCTKGYILCRDCGHENGTGHICKEKKCVNCKTVDHAANDKNCPSYLRAKEIEKIMVTSKKTRFEARKQFYECYGSLENFMTLRGLTTAEVLKRAANNDTIKPPTDAHNAPNGQSHQKINQSNPSSKKVSSPVYKNTTEKRQPTATVTTDDDGMQAETIIDETTTTKNQEQVEQNYRNKFKLLKFRKIDGGITYYIETSFKEGKTPHLDLANFKGKGKRYVDELSYLKQVFENQEMMNTIQTTLNNNLNNHILEFTNQNAEIFLKTSSALDMESSEDSDFSDSSLAVNV